MTLVLSISQWKTKPTHFYGTIRDGKGEVVQEILQCSTRERVIEIAKNWAAGKQLKIIERVRYF